MTADDVAKLLSQGAEADQSVRRSVGDLNAAIATVKYAGVRNVTLALSTESFRMFAVAIDSKNGPRDIVLTRTPELAHFIVQLVTLGDEAFPMLKKALETSNG